MIPTSSSSSSSVAHYGRLTTGLKWLSSCRKPADISNPSFGHSLGMCYRGSFSVKPALYENGTLLERGGITTTKASNGAIYLPNARQLFSIASGAVHLWMTLPYAIVNGVYEETEEESCSITDYIIWAVNVGQDYITSPGIYAALTPAGIEFTIWTAAGKYTILNTTATIAENTPLDIEWAWNSEPQGTIAEGVMWFSVNGGSATIPCTIDSRTDINNLNFWMLDTPHNNRLLCSTIERMEIFSNPTSLELSSSSSFSSNSSPSSSTVLSFSTVSSSTAISETSSSSSKSSSSPSSSSFSSSTSSTLSSSSSSPSSLSSPSSSTPSGESSSSTIISDNS